MKFSANFDLKEFVDSQKISKLGSLQYRMLGDLSKNILQPVRDFLCHEYGKEVAMQVTNGVRFWEDVLRIQKQGGNPSMASDHFCGMPVMGFIYGAGAADVVFGVSAEEVFAKLMDYCDSDVSKGVLHLPGGDVHVGQMILEKHFSGGKVSWWIHFSNPRMSYFPDYKKVVWPFLRSNDGGKTYLPAKGGAKA